MPSFYLYHQSRIHYTRSGKGKKILVCFHGYGDDCSSFSFLEKGLENDYTTIAIDLPYHGMTSWNEDYPFYPQNLVEIVQAIVDKEMTGKKDLSCVGYSMGGRVVLQLVQLIPLQIQKIILIAPDGLVINIWYWLATQTYAGNKLFQYVMQHPGPFLKMVELGSKLGLVNKSIFKFVHHYLDDAKMRDELYVRWTALRKIKPYLPAVKKNILRHNISIRFLYGKHDRIILPKRAEQFCESLQGLAVVKTIPAGHQLLQAKYDDVIIELLNY